MEYETHNTTHVETNMSCLQGYCETGYGTLVEKFGEPTLGGDKTDVEWHIKFKNGVVATLYNWKNGPSYCGPNGIHPTQNTRWNIGGFDKRAAEEIYSVLGYDTARETSFSQGELYF